MIIAHATRARDVAQRLALIVALGGVAWGCPRGGTKERGGDLYAHGRIHVSKETAARWDANERDIAEVGEGIKSIPADDRNPQTIPFPGDARATLEALKPSERHGATDKRMLSLLGPKRTVVSSGIVAQITMVKGSEYKSEANFRKGWLPLAIIVLPDTFPAGAVVYPKLQLHGGTSWLYAREDSSSKWEAALVRLIDGKVEQQPLNISVSTDDKVEPVIGARFNWEDDDESVWVYCSGNCCKVGPGQ